MTEHIQIADVASWTQVTQTEADTNKVDFDFQFPFFKTEDVEVYLDGELQSTGYTVAGAGVSEGGTVTFDTIPPNQTEITMRRRLGIQRTTDFQESGEFRAKVLNDELDYQTAAIQQVADDLTRSLRLPATDPYMSMELPAKSERAESLLAFDSNGKPVAAAGDSSVLVSAFMEPIFMANDADAFMGMISLTPFRQEITINGDGDAASPLALNHTPYSTVDVQVWLNNVPQLANWTVGGDGFYPTDFYFDFSPDDSDTVTVAYRANGGA